MKYKSVAEVFSQISKSYDRFLHLATVGRIHSWQRELVSMMNPSGNWLDVGTGTAEVLVKIGKDYKGLKVGIDPSFQMLKIAERKCKDCFFLQGIGEALPFKEKSFSNITLSLVFRHLEDKIKFLEEAHRTLQDKGKIGIIDVARFKGTFVLAFLMKTLLKPIGFAIFGKEKWEFFIHSVEESYSVQEIDNMLQLKGFKTEKIKKKLLGLIYIISATKTA